MTQANTRPEVEVRRSRRRTRTVSAYRKDGKVIVLIPDRFTRAEEAEWVEQMLERLERPAKRARRTDAQLMRRAEERRIASIMISSSIRWSLAG